ncbi:MAG: hypothetical protein R3230_05610 [Nitrosopumilaceae archaeon]|nr:hypothetical protein [Nitrosopumilaceae archaeon]
MAKEEIKKLLENSEKNITQTHDDFAKSIKDDLQKFKKKTLDQI